jgi:hypothetical protein
MRPGFSWSSPPDVNLVLPEESIATFCASPLPCFSQEALVFIDDLSKTLREGTKGFPSLLSLGFWLRSANIVSKAETATGRSPLGVVFHVVPSNVPTVGVFSWLLALLMGNPSVIRLSSQASEEQAELLRVVLGVIASPQHAAIRSRTRFIRYEHQESFTRWFSDRCALRVVWGGDSSVESIRKVPLNAQAQEVAFPDRRSLLLVDSAWLEQIAPAERQHTYERLSTDLTTFAQLACSSPTLLVWVGPPSSTLRAELLNRVFQGFSGSASYSVNRYLNAQLNAALVPDVDFEFFKGVSVSRFAAPVHLPFVGFGMLSEWVVGDLTTFANEHWNIQTLVFVGEQKASLRSSLHRSTSRVDRIVSPGQALGFDWVWDGLDLLSLFSRQRA